MKKLFTLLVFTVGTVCYAFSMDNSDSQYTGRYKFSDNVSVPTAEVLMQDNALVLSSPMGVATLHHLEGDLFSIDELHGTVEFVRSADKKVSKLIIKMMAFELEGAREPAKRSMLFHPLSPGKFLTDLNNNENG